MVWLCTFPLWAPVLLLALYAVWVQKERGGWWLICRHIYPPFIALDVLLAHTVFPVCLQYIPRHGEWTFSAQLERLVKNNGWRGFIARRLAQILNRIAPSGKHI